VGLNMAKDVLNKSRLTDEQECIMFRVLNDIEPEIEQPKILDKGTILQLLFLTGILTYANMSLFSNNIIEAIGISVASVVTGVLLAYYVSSRMS
jgi:hypothetical protein